VPGPGIGVLTRVEMRAWDRHAIDERGMGDRLLMEVAGRTAASVVHARHPRGRVVAAVGRGNNGGDALVLLRTLHAWGRDVLAVPVGEREPDDLLAGWEIPLTSPEESEGAFRSAEVLIDGLLGTGAEGAPRTPEAGAIRALMAAARPIIALDGPSGVDMETGKVPGDAVRADATVTFAALKRGLLRFPGRAHAGHILVAEVGFPPAPVPHSGIAVTDCWVRDRLPPVPLDAHKGTLGAVVIVAGSHGMAGAAALVARAATRTGVGMARLVSSAANREILQGAVPEAIFADREDERLESWLEDADAVVAGPGLGTDGGALDLLRTVLRSGAAPLLLDADALNLLAEHADLADSLRERRVLLSPHPGEMGRLLERGVSEVVSDPFTTVREAADRFGCAVLLKGSPSLVAAPEGPVLVGLAGHSGLAHAGMGDTLSGVAGALLAQGCAPAEAGAAALHLSGRAGILSGRGRGLLPIDVADALTRALAERPAPPSDVPGIVLELAPPE
jgi:ADP-dependent NAD(P)H-hydrate dehydratase / NAD(P)H-hydrate epimerase